MTEANKKQTKKKPPFHEAVIATLDKILCKPSLEPKDCYTITCQAFGISNYPVPEESRPRLTATLISVIKKYGDDDEICEACAMAINSMDTTDLVEEEMGKESLNDDEMANLQALLQAIGKLSGEQIPDDKNAEAPDLNFADILEAAPPKIHVFGADDTASELSPEDTDPSPSKKTYGWITGGNGSRTWPAKYLNARPISPHHIIISLWIDCRPRTIGPKSKETYIEVNGFVLRVTPEGVIAADGHFTRLLPAD